MNTRRLFAGTALLLGIGAALAGSPFRAASPEDRVTAIELATWIRDRRPGLRVIDVRPADDFGAYQIPMAENLPPDTLDRLEPRPGEIVVVYAQDVAAVDRAVAQLRSTGRSDVFVLDGGVNAWIDDVMNPARSTDVTKYFGGVARPPGAARTVRRGC